MNHWYVILFVFFILCFVHFENMRNFAIGFNRDFIVKVKLAFDFSDRILWLHITYRMQFNIFTGIFFAVCV